MFLMMIVIIVTGYEIDRCDKKLKSSKHAIKSIYLSFFSNFFSFLTFSETFTIKLPEFKISANLGKNSLEKKEF